MPPDEPIDEERREELPEDQQTPFRPAEEISPLKSEDVDTRIDEAEDNGRPGYTHPQTDANLDPQEYYDAGLEHSAETREPNAGNAVEDYHPDHKISEEKPEDKDLGNENTV